jgi:hypothetical protein
LVISLIVYFFFVETAGPKLEGRADLYNREEPKHKLVGNIEEKKDQVQYEEHVKGKYA